MEEQQRNGRDGKTERKKWKKEGSKRVREREVKKRQIGLNKIKKEDETDKRNNL